MNTAQIQPTTVERMSYKEAIVRAEIEEMERDESVILMGEGLRIYGEGKALDLYGAHRVWNTPISENSVCGLAVGAAMTGLRPVVCLNIASFLYLASDQIINQASKLPYMTGGQMKVPVVFRCGIYYNNSLAAQHSDRCYSMFMNTPGLKILAPTNAADMKGLLKSAIRDDDPVLLFEDISLWTTKGEVSTDPDLLVPIGRADIKHPGNDATLVAIAGCVKPALAAAQALVKEGISVEVIDPRTLVPLDFDAIIQSVAKTGRLIVMDNAHRTCNAAAEIAATIAQEAFGYLKKPIIRLTTPDVHIPFSPALERQLYPSKESVIAAVKELL